MKQPDLDTLNRKVYGHDRIRLLRCRPCRAEFSEQRDTALFNTKLPELKAEEVLNHFLS